MGYPKKMMVILLPSLRIDRLLGGGMQWVSVRTI